MEHGIPEKILTDQGTNFTSELFKNVCKLLKIEKIQTMASRERGIRVFTPNSRGIFTTLYKRQTDELGRLVTLRYVHL